MNLPPVEHTCCGTPCFYENVDEDLPCWGYISCIDTDYVDDDEYRYGACEGHWDMYRDYDKAKYNKYSEDIK